MELNQREKIKSILFLSPAIICFVVFLLIPMLYTVYLSFFDWNMIRPEMDFVGLDNYIKIFTDETTYKVLRNTFSYIGIILITNFCIPFVFAFVCKFVLHKFANFYKTTMFMPGFISLIVGSVIFTWILNPIVGPVALFLKEFGVKMPVWSTTEGLVIVVISLITSWKSFGYNFIMLYSAVSGVSGEVIEAAQLDNIPLRKIFLQIVAPMTGFTSFYMFVMTIIQGLTYVISPIDVLTKGGPNYGSSNIVYAAYFKAFYMFDTGGAAAMAVITLVIFGFGLFLLNEVVGKLVYYEN
ncbi:sugar ABC transporter permease [Chakrabartyella piscis]|uniref:carbohydrate ABC transporter permease n=1 Tax=Chakrabartyella piscis TaxID=2918914 RepID=UPI002958DB20|nr:sugar ABC transporter permease [Chakrabartyella piscis]